MSFTEPLHITDPKTMRALAHPVRIALIHRLIVGPATATECSTAVGESPSSCSYHLRKLAELGFVDEVGSDDGRERRWRLSPVGHSFDVVGTPEQRSAAALLRAEIGRRNSQIINEYLTTESSYPDAWIQAAIFSSYTLFLTLEELNDLGERIHGLLNQYRERTDPALRPLGAQRVALIMYGVPWAIPPEQFGSE